ncbi:Hypothetical_protein [Hexamita inflata]|uniref:Hypothetical_protein n=1 Tax=Hexamita inflata TaxID=28002 RepID=A0AA86NHA5_9EUKA|nr:Hypothetical protein HINF_LOCUS6881 [Hexamita inflata]
MFAITQNDYKLVFEWKQIKNQQTLQRNNDKILDYYSEIHVIGCKNLQPTEFNMYDILTKSKVFIFRRCSLNLGQFSGQFTSITFDQCVLNNLCQTCQINQNLNVYVSQILPTQIISLNPLNQLNIQVNCEYSFEMYNIFEKLSSTTKLNVTLIDQIIDLDKFYGKYCMLLLQQCKIVGICKSSLNVKSLCIQDSIFSSNSLESLQFENLQLLTSCSLNQIIPLTFNQNKIIKSCNITGYIVDITTISHALIYLKCTKCKILKYQEQLTVTQQYDEKQQVIDGKIRINQLQYSLKLIFLSNCEFNFDLNSSSIITEKFEVLSCKQTNYSAFKSNHCRYDDCTLTQLPESKHISLMRCTMQSKHQCNNLEEFSFQRVVLNRFSTLMFPNLKNIVFCDVDVSENVEQTIGQIRQFIRFKKNNQLAVYKSQKCLTDKRKWNSQLRNCLSVNYCQLKKVFELISILKLGNQ